jgi:hypothetical protein
MQVSKIKSWLEVSITPFAWQRITIKLLPEFQREGLYLHNIKDETLLSKNLVENIEKALFELYQINFPSEMYHEYQVKELRGQFFKDRNAYIAQDEPCIFHCHHYNTYLQAVIEDTSSYLDVYPILTRSSQEIAYSQFSSFFKENNLDIDRRKKIVEDFFRFCGFGVIDLSAADSNGGKVVSGSDHYGVGWQSKFGQRDNAKSGVSFFTNGFVAGALEAIYDLPNGTLESTQSACIAKGDAQSVFVLSKSLKSNYFQPSPAQGVYQTGKLFNSPLSDVDTLAIREALIGMPLEGAEKTGLIDAFGVLLTRMYSNYYCLISYRFLRLFEEKMGAHGTETARELLTEAGHVCAFNTFGGIMQSAEWNGLIRPMLKNREDWIYGIVSVVNALGWGIWEIEDLDADKKLVIKITGGYEANSFIKIFGKSAYPISFLATGGTAGIMNLIYNTGITQQPISLDDAQYQKMYASSKLFVAKQKSCRAMDDEFDLFEATLR